jgi:hypothetical protein
MDYLEKVDFSNKRSTIGKICCVLAYTLHFPLLGSIFLSLTVIVNAEVDSKFLLIYVQVWSLVISWAIGLMYLGQ